MKVTHALQKSGLPFYILDAWSEVRELFEDGHCPINKDSSASSITPKLEFTAVLLQPIDRFSPLTAVSVFEERKFSTFEQSDT